MTQSMLGYPRRWPTSIRLVITTFLVMIGSGYLFALLNIYTTHQLADGKEGLTFDDLKAVYVGLEIEVTEETELPSEMLTMIRGDMREFFSTSEEFETLEQWLLAGASEEGFTQEALPADASPQAIIQDNCLRCHIPEGEKGQEKAHRSPFANDLFDEADYALVSQHTTSEVTTDQGKQVIEPTSNKHLILISHIHMLSIPVFTLITSLLVWATRLPPRLRGLIIAVPMMALFFDFIGWWLARAYPPSVWLIALTGPIYGVFLALQIFSVTGSMWLGRRKD